MHKSALVILLFGVVLFTVAGVANHNFYVDNVYEIDQIGSLLSNAQSTNNLFDKATHMSTVLHGLLGYHGNPDWLYPVDYTNFDSIKTVLTDTISTTLDLNSRTDVDSMSYQQSLSVVDDTITVIKDRIDSTAHALNSNPEKNPITWWVTIIVLTVGVITIWLVDCFRPNGWRYTW